MTMISKLAYVPPVPEYNNPKEFGHYVEKIGYVPIQRQVDSFFRAGQRVVDLDDNFDTFEDDPSNFDDPAFRVRDMELSEIGHEMSKFADKLTDSARQAAAAESAAEAGKNEVSGESPETES